VASDLEGRVDGPDHLIAVTGLGRSTNNTRNFVHELSRHKIGIVAAAITGDDMTQDNDSSGPVRGMVRVAPTNSDQALAATKFIDNDPMFRSGSTILEVQDQVRGDDYYATLGPAFDNALKSAQKNFSQATKIIFDSSLAGAGTVLAGDVGTICSDKADIIYYAGPTDVLQTFLGGLAKRSCAGGSDARSLTVITGAGFGRAQGQVLWRSADANLTVLFTGLAHPDMWTTSQGVADGEIVTRFQDCAKRPDCFGTLFPQEPKGALNDGDVIISHDAVLTVEEAIEKIVTQRTIVPSASQVAQELNHVQVPAASGWICSFDQNHNPVDKAVPILEIDQNGTVSYQGLSSASSSGNLPNGCPS
jgi:hypothetical protein